MRRFPRFGLALILLVSLLLAGLPLPVLAQGGTVLAVDPAQASVEVNGQREIHLLVTGADSLNAFDVQVEYDFGFLTLARWEFGDLLSNLAVVKRDDLPGSFRLVATQLATPGVSGDGVLLKLFFKGKVEGSSAITITKAEFARSEGGLSLPELEHGSMTVIPAQPTATATVTHTPTATATMAPTATATMTPTATATLAPTVVATLTRMATSTATLAASATPAATLTAGRGTATLAATLVATNPAGATATPEAGTEEVAPAATQPEPTRAAAEGGEALPGTTGQGGVSGSGNGSGYILQKTRGSGPTATGVILFFAGLLAIGAAAAYYTFRKIRN
jgi:hypothetical protein